MDELAYVVDYACGMQTFRLVRQHIDQHPTLVDGVIALVLGVLAQLSLWLEWSIADPQPDVAIPLASSLLVLLIVPLIWRRRYPYAVLLACTAVLVAAAAFNVPGLEWTVNAWALGFYSAGVYGREQWRTPVRALALVSFMGVVVYQFVWLTQDQFAASPGFLVIVPIIANLLIGGATWWFSDEVRRSRERQSALAARTAQLEREREINARQAVLEERVRIARELHDVVAHHVSLMGVQAGAARRVLPSDPAKSEELLNAIESSSRETVAELHRLLGFLRREEEDALMPQPNLRQIETLIGQIQDAGLQVSLTVEGESRPLSPGVELSAFRIVQEALTNTLKHAGPAQASVTIHYTESALEIEICDDGAGAAPESQGSGNGMLGMRERVSLLGGSFRAGPRRGDGFRVQATLPLNARAT